MIYSMITGDMFTFAIIYIIVLFGFSQAYFFLYKGHENVEDTPYGTYPSTWMGLFQTTLGDYDVSPLYPKLTPSVDSFIDFMTLPLRNFHASVRATERHLLPQSRQNGLHHLHDIRSDFAAQHVDCHDGFVICGRDCHFRSCNISLTLN